MLEQLMDLIRQHAGDAVVNNPAVPNEHNEAVISEAGSSIVGGLKTMVANGNTQDVINLFRHQGGDIASTPAAQQLSGGFIQHLMSKFGLDQGAASGVANNLLPQVLQQFVHKTNDPYDNSFNLQGVVSQLTGGSIPAGLDVQGLPGKFTQEGASGGNVPDSIKSVFNR